MRRIIACLTLVLFFVSTASAQTAVPNNATVSSALNTKVGVAAAVKGQVQLLRGEQVGQVVSSGAEIFLGDKISTDAKGGLQILLLDQTTFTIGANSSIVVDKFIYDPATDAGKVTVRVVEGTFRFITGKIAHKNPENMQVELPNGTIGIRGTMVMGRIVGNHSQVVLTGPGDKNNTGSRRGEIIVGGRGENETKFVRIAKTGFGTEIEGGGSPKMPFKVPQIQLNEMTSELSPPSEEKDSGKNKSNAADGGNSDSSGGPAKSGESAAEQSGQANVDVAGDLRQTNSFTGLSATLTNESTKSVQDSADESGQILDGLASVGDLGKTTSGQAHFAAVNFPLFDGNGSQSGHFDAQYDIDFGARTVGGGNSKILGQAGVINSNSAFQFVLPSQTFGNPGDLAVYNYSNLTDSNGCATCHADIAVLIGNTGGNVATGAIVVASVTDTAGSQTVNGIAQAPRQPGLS